MKLTCQLTIDDFVAFNEYHVAHSPLHIKQARQHRYIPTIIYFMMAAIFCAIHAVVAATLCAFFSLGWFLTEPRRLRLRRKKLIEKHLAETIGDSLSEPSCLEVCEDGIHASGYLGQSIFKFSSVGAIAQEGVYTFVYIGKGQALVLPDDRLPADQIQTFVDGVRSRKG